MKTNILKSFLPHIVAAVLFLIASYAYFSPLIEGKKLAQHDIAMFVGSAKEIQDYNSKTGDVTLWTNSMFCGMPAFMISVPYSGNLLAYVNRLLEVGSRPASFIFLTMLGFYVLLLVLGVNPWLSIVGAFAYGLSSYFFIVIGAGHNSKIHAIAYVAPMIAGMIQAFRGKYFAGFAVFGLFFGLNLFTGHPQITYYAMLIMIALGISYLITAYKEKLLLQFGKSVAVLAIAGILAFGANFSKLWFTYDYGKESIRGPSELTHDKENRTSGLDKDYVTGWSYGVAESFNLLIPNLMGGASAMDLGEDSETYKMLKNLGVPNGQASSMVKQSYTYWGDQPGTSGPMYIGAIVVFLFVFGLFAVKGVNKWAILIITALAIALAMGHNFKSLTYFFLDYFPGYNKFRSVTMINYIAEFTMPFLGFIALKKLYDNELDKKTVINSLKWSLGVVGGICLLFLLFGSGLFDFVSASDQQLKQAAGYPDELINALRSDRASLLKADALRSLIYILLSAGVLYAFFIKKLKPYYFIAILGLLIIADMWVVNKRYMNNDRFVSEIKVQKPFSPTVADNEILKDPALSYRVIDLSGGFGAAFNDATASYFHKSLGGYHGAKMRRYQDLVNGPITQDMIAFQNLLSSQNIEVVMSGMNKLGVFNMLNTKYFILNSENAPLMNPAALGNAWFVDTIQIAPNADAEIAALNGFNPKTKAIIDQRFKKYLEGIDASYDTTGTIELTSYAPNKLVYKSETNSTKVAVFSEMYYAKGWTVTVDGKEADHFRANYVLRAMLVPAGTHEIVFTFKPKMFEIGKSIDLASSLLLILVVLGWIAFEVRAKLKEQTE